MNSTHQNWSETTLSGVLSSDLGGAALSRSLSSSSLQRSDCRVGRRRCAVAFFSETQKYSRLADANCLYCFVVDKRSVLDKLSFKTGGTRAPAYETCLSMSYVKCAPGKFEDQANRAFRFLSLFGLRFRIFVWEKKSARARLRLGDTL